MKNISVQIGSDNYEAAISTLKFTPATTIQTWKGGTPAAVYTDVTTPTWTCAMTLAQDYAAATSLANYLLENVGESVTCIFKPSVPGTGTQAIVTATLILAAPEIGGDIDAWMSTAITHAVSGAPAVSVA
jgi:hypothetical protein